MEGLKRLSKVSGIFRLYVHAADTKAPVELTRYVKGLTPDDYQLVGNGPIRLVVAFPRPRLSVLARETEAERGQRWVKALTGLPVRRAVLRLASGLAGTVQVTDVADPGATPGFNISDFERFLSAAIAGSGQSAKEVEQAQVWRREEAERVVGAQGPEPRGLPNAGDPPAHQAGRNAASDKGQNPRQRQGSGPSSDQKTRERRPNGFSTNGSEGKPSAPPSARESAAFNPPIAQTLPIAEDGSLA